MEKLWLNSHVANATNHSWQLYLTSKKENHKDLSRQIYSVDSNDYCSVDDCDYNA